jgi:hypothetical protein
MAPRVALGIRCPNFVDAQRGTPRLGLIHEKFNVSDCSSSD